MSMKLIMEGFREYLNEEHKQPQGMHDVPQNMYHGVQSGDLDGLRDNGIVNLPSELEFEEDKTGIPCSEEFEGAQKYGDVILELDGEQIAGSGQYTLNPSGVSGVRIGMTDSAVNSGHGVHDMVDKLGTNIPFQFVKKMIFTGDTFPNVRKLKDAGFAGVEIATTTDQPGEFKTMWKPPEEEPS